MRRLAAAAMLMLTVTLTAACSSKDSGVPTADDVPSDQVIVPAKAPDDWQSATIDGLSISAPADWEKTGPVAVENGNRVQFKSAASSFGTRGGAQLAVLSDPPSSAERLAKATASEAKATVGADDVKTVEVVWPGASSAWYVSFTADVPREGTTAPHPTASLFLDLPSGAQAQATVTALGTDAAARHLEAALASVTVTAQD